MVEKDLLIMKSHFPKIIPLIAASILELVIAMVLPLIEGAIGGGGLFRETVCFSLPRFILICFISYAVYAFRPHSRLYSLGLSGKQSVIIAVSVVAIHALVFFAIPFHFADDPRFESGFTKFDGAVYDDAQQYAYLADAFLSGHLYLDLEVPEYMLEMDNPYDAAERARLAIESGEPSYWDYAFYDGKYYCYFGALPAVILFVPYKVLTGMDLPTYWAVAISAVLLCLAAAMLIRLFLQVFFPRSSLGFYLLIFMMFVMGFGITTQVFYPLFYSLPPLWSLFVLSLGFSCWLLAKQKNLNKVLLALGAFFVSLTLFCRPQMFIYIFLAIGLFEEELFRERLFFSRKGMGNTFAIVLPCVLVGCVAMAYNAARFGSFFDFGASYNLTGFDMTAKPVSLTLDKAWYAIVFYVCTPIIIGVKFPYITATNWQPMPVEPFHGGFFAFNPSSIALIALPFLRKQLSCKGLWILCLECLSIAVLLMLFSTYFASISMRYMTDFSLGLLIPTACIWLGLFERSEKTRRSSLLVWCFVLSIALSEFLGFWSLMAVERYGSFAAANPWLFALLESWFSV